MNRREQDTHEDLCRRLVTALNERDAALAENARLRAAVERLCADPWTATRAFGDPRYAEGVSRRGAVGYGAFVRVDQLRAALAAPTADDGAERGAR